MCLLAEMKMQRNSGKYSASSPTSVVRLDTLQLILKIAHGFHEPEEGVDFLFKSLLVG